MTTHIGHEALIPNPHLTPFLPFIGTWKTIGDHTMMPGVTLHGRTVFEWHEGGAYVCVRSEIDEPKVPSAVAIVGTDDEADQFTMLYSDERTVTRRFDVSVDGMVLTWRRTAPGFSQRYVLTISEDGSTMHGESFLCQDDVNWERDLTQDYTRVA